MSDPVEGSADKAARLVISLRPYNPEGVSFVHDIALLENRMGWKVNLKNYVYFNILPEQCEISYYRHGDVYSRLPLREGKNEIWCRVGMASAAAVYELREGQTREITVSAPLDENVAEKGSYTDDRRTAQLAWEKSLQPECSLQIPDEHFKFLYETAVRTMVLHSPKEVYPGRIFTGGFGFVMPLLYYTACYASGSRNASGVPWIVSAYARRPKVISSPRKANGILTARPCGSCASIVR